ncbi:Cobalamin synthase [hydrothermal vent metagenome]|uniref:Adenosylcobinamide-GDP ribazoletransferase n=1 Tax=hydrothermal vent metagenome TaxID=652676 RepID=A0A3B0UW08_9ZZZZ
MIGSFTAALQFLTLLRLSRNGNEYTPEEFSRSMVFFPVVGALQGLILFIVYIVLGALLSPGLLGAVLVAVLIITNGGLHLDGFVDTVDGLAGGATPERRLEIMRDSAVGAIGVVALVILLILKYESLSSVSVEAAGAIFLFPVIGRWTAVPVAYLANYAREGEGLGRLFSEVKVTTLIYATLITVVPVVVILGLTGLIATVGVFIAAALVTAFFKRKIGGVTGDVMGFQGELGEVLFLIIVIIAGRI